MFYNDTEQEQERELQLPCL